MASPTEAECQDQIRRVIKILDETHLFASVTATNNWVAMEDALVQALESDYSVDTLNAVFGTRSRLSSMLADAAGLLMPGFLTYAKQQGYPERDASAIFDRLSRRFAASALAVASRQFTFAAPAAAGGNVGNGAILRLNTDARNFSVENQWAEAKSCIVVGDQNTGSSMHEELIEFRGSTRRRDNLEWEAGSGLVSQFNAMSARSSILSNPSFSLWEGALATTPTIITDWTSNVAIVGDGSDYTLDGVNYYRNIAGETPYALNIKLTRTLTQKLNLRNTALDKDAPYMVQVAWNRAVGAASGTLELHIGSRSVSVVAAAQAGWQILRIALDTNSWPENFEQNETQVKLVWTRTGGNLLVDEVLVVPGVNFGGGWYWPVGGSTPWLLDDEFTWTDTEVGAKLQRWFFRALGLYLPSATGGAVTWTEP